MPRNVPILRELNFPLDEKHASLKPLDLLITVESHINESHIKDQSHINDVQAAYQLSCTY